MNFRTYGCEIKLQVKDQLNVTLISFVFSNSRKYRDTEETIPAYWQLQENMTRLRNKIKTSCIKPEKQHRKTLEGTTSSALMAG